MARSKLHVICGTCGDNENLTFKIDPEGRDISESEEETKFESTVFIYCGNCATIHDLDDFVPMKRENKGAKS